MPAEKLSGDSRVGVDRRIVAETLDQSATFMAAKAVMEENYGNRKLFGQL